MSTAAEVYTIIVAIEQAEKTMNLKKGWKSQNKIQERFLNEYLPDCRGSEIPEITTEVSTEAEKINNFLEKKGFSIRLEPFPPNTFGFASILDLIVEWLILGTNVEIKAKNDKIYPGIRIEKRGVSFFKSKLQGYLYTIARLGTKSGDMIFITIPKESPNGMDLIEIADNISNNMEISLGVYNGIRFPMVDLDITTDIGWLKGMSTANINNMPAKITQAIQQIKIKMNEKGARFHSGAAIAVTLTMASPKEDLIIREPFLLWVKRDGLKKPLMAAFITEENWKNPGNLV